ncbi:pseudoazurin [Sphingomonas oligophenolica]
MIVGAVLATTQAIARERAAPQATPHERIVQMRNRGASGFFVFEPSLTRAMPGDTIRFVPTDMGHDVVAVPGMLPAGVAPFKGEMGQAFTIKVTKSGVYGFKCTPHYAMGMVGLIVVGKPINLAAAAQVDHPGKAKQVFAALLAQAAKP